MTCTPSLTAAGCTVAPAPTARFQRLSPARLRAAWRAWWGRRVAAWQARRARARAFAELELAAELGEATLRDIGAPEWLINEAAAHSAIRREQLSSVWFGPQGRRH